MQFRTFSEAFDREIPAHFLWIVHAFGRFPEGIGPLHWPIWFGVCFLRNQQCPILSTHRSLTKMATIWQTTFSNAFVSMKMLQLFKILVKFLDNGLMNMKWALVQVMAWHQISISRALFQYLIRHLIVRSRSIEAMRFVFRIVWSIWNLTCTSAALLPRCLPKFKRCNNLNYQSFGFGILC